jgi:acyl-CoA reductase-like NAD-dependent aldehyde dehydrogenase
VRQPEFVLEHKNSLFIGGDWVEPSTSRRLDIIHPATEELALQVAEAREADIDRAITEARRAFDIGPWPRLSAKDRAAYLLRFADAIDHHQQQIAIAQTLQIGVPIGMTQRSVAGLSGEPRRVAALAETYRFSEERKANGGTAVIVREPVGVVAAIVPWNFPAHLGLLKICPALLAGCTVIVKPSPEAPLDMLVIAEAAREAGFPPGVLSILPADRDMGDRLIRDPRIDKVSFTGSGTAGKHIGSVCMQRMARVSLELGGKSAALVLDDAPLAQVVPTLVGMSTLLNGQACMALTRVLVSQQRKDELTQSLSKAFAELSLGDPFDPATRIGPLATARQRERVEGYIARGLSEGARMVTGGKRPSRFARGYFIEPTVFADVDNKMTIAQEEIFGPVVSVIAYDTLDHAINIANDSVYGLSGAVFSMDSDRVLDIARRIRTGTVAQNALGPQSGQPFGGFKQSGIGREGSIEALDLFTEVKAVYLGRPPTSSAASP